MSQRKVIQIATLPQSTRAPAATAALYALCDDGTMWVSDAMVSWKPVTWKPVTAIPQPAGAEP